MKDTFANRLRKAMENKGINQTELVKETEKYEIKIGSDLINKYLKGNALARQNRLTILATILQVSEAWLMGYDVPYSANKYINNSLDLDEFKNIPLSDYEIKICKAIEEKYSKRLLDMNDDDEKKIKEIASNIIIDIKQYKDINKKNVLWYSYYLLLIYIKETNIRVSYISILYEHFYNYINNIEKKHTSTASQTVKIPLLGKVAAGEPIFAEENVEEYLEINEELAKKGEFFALTIKGDSMFPYLLNDDILIVRKQDDVESGDIAVVLINGDEATVKQVFKNSDGIMLTAFNQQVWQPRTYNNKEIEELPVKIIGRFAELRRRKFM